MNTAESVDVVKLILASYPSQRQRMSDEDVRGMYKAYAAGLGDLPFDLVRIGITKLVKTAKWMPTIADIRGATVTARDGRAREGAEGWGDVIRAIGKHGGNRTPGKDFEFADQLVARVVHAIGWREICQSEFQIADRARFIELYDQLAEHDAVDRVSGMESPVNKLPSGTRPVVAVVPKLELVGEEPQEGESQGDTIKRLSAQVLSSLAPKPIE